MLWIVLISLVAVAAAVVLILICQIEVCRTSKHTGEAVVLSLILANSWKRSCRVESWQLIDIFLKKRSISLEVE